LIENKDWIPSIISLSFFLESTDWSTCSIIPKFARIW
jgi:hypothetical protein